MDWNAAIEKNREALKGVLAILVAMAGIGGAAFILPRYLHCKVLRLLRPAEAAARRLVIVAARGLEVPPARLHEPKPKPAILCNGVGTGILTPSHLQAGRSRPAPRTLALPLFDPLPGWGDRRRPVAKSVPRISVPGYTERLPVAIAVPPSPRDPIDARRLLLRFQALGRVLDDLPRHARRFARWRARGKEAAQDKKPHRPFRRVWPLRPGRPPGWRRNPVHDVHEILNVTHGLAIWALEDTS